MSFKNPSMAGVDGESCERTFIYSGRASLGQTNPALNTKGRELNKIVGVATSLDLKRVPKKIPKKMLDSKNGTPNVSKLLMDAR